jgi:hypothetical protein
VLQSHDVHDGQWLLLHDDDERRADVLQLLIASFYVLASAPAEKSVGAFFRGPRLSRGKGGVLCSRAST